MSQASQCPKSTWCRFINTLCIESYRNCNSTMSINLFSPFGLLIHTALRQKAYHLESNVLLTKQCTDISRTVTNRLPQHLLSMVNCNPHTFCTQVLEWWQFSPHLCHFSSDLFHKWIPHNRTGAIWIFSICIYKCEDRSIHKYMYEFKAYITRSGEIYLT